MVKTKINTKNLKPSDDGVMSLRFLRLDKLSRLNPISMVRQYARRDREVYKLEHDPKTLEVFINSKVSLHDYQVKTLTQDWGTLKKFANKMSGKTVIFINSTMEGGGVAMMRPPLVHLLNLLGVDSHWYVMESNNHSDKSNPFVFTKLMHNILQRLTASECRIDEAGKKMHKQWNKENSEILIKQNHIKDADVIVIDDPQPAPLKQLIGEVNKTAKYVWRSHIDTDADLMSDPSSPQGEVASYLLDELGIKTVDAIISHPVKKFIYPGMNSKTFFVPATVDLFDDLNRPLGVKEIRTGIAFINREISIQNKNFLAQKRFDDTQSRINPNRRQIILVARFDEAKGMDKAIAIGLSVREKMRCQGVTEAELPQIVIIGNGSIDDPSGVPMYEAMLKIRRELYDDKKDIVIMRLSHNYTAINALMSLAEKEHSWVVALQTSEAEGCETRITDWILHGVPVVISNRGGMHLQLLEGQSGLVLDYDKNGFDIERGAEFISEIMMDRNKYISIRNSTLEMAKKFNAREFTTTANATRLLRVFCKVIENKKADKIWKISDLS